MKCFIFITLHTFWYFRICQDMPAWECSSEEWVTITVTQLNSLAQSPVNALWKSQPSISLPQTAVFGNKGSLECLATPLRRTVLSTVWSPPSSLLFCCSSASALVPTQTLSFFPLQWLLLLWQPSTLSTSSALPLPVLPQTLLEGTPIGSWQTPVSGWGSYPVITPSFPPSTHSIIHHSRTDFVLGSSLARLYSQPYDPDFRPQHCFLRPALPDTNPSFPSSVQPVSRYSFPATGSWNPEPSSHLRYTFPPQLLLCLPDVTSSSGAHGLWRLSGRYLFLLVWIVSPCRALMMVYSQSLLHVLSVFHANHMLAKQANPQLHKGPNLQGMWSWGPLTRCLQAKKLMFHLFLIVK